MVAKIQSNKASATTRNTRSKTTLQEQKNKDPNAGVFTDTSGYVSESLNIEWSKMYTSFDNDEFSCVDHDQPAYVQIHNSQLHRVAARPPFMPYTDPIKWELDHVDLKQREFVSIDNAPIALFHSNVFARAYALATPKRLLSSKFFDKTLAKFNYKEVVKSWLEDPTIVVLDSLPTYLVSWFKEPFLLQVIWFTKLFLIQSEMGPFGEPYPSYR